MFGRFTYRAIEWRLNFGNRYSSLGDHRGRNALPPNRICDSPEPNGARVKQFTEAGKQCPKARHNTVNKTLQLSDSFCVGECLALELECRPGPALARRVLHTRGPVELAGLTTRQQFAEPFSMQRADNDRWQWPHLADTECGGGRWALLGCALLPHNTLGWWPSWGTNQPGSARGSGAPDPPTRLRYLPLPPAALSEHRTRAGGMTAQGAARHASAGPRSGAVTL